SQRRTSSSFSKAAPPGAVCWPARCFASMADNCLATTIFCSSCVIVGSCARISVIGKEVSYVQFLLRSAPILGRSNVEVERSLGKWDRVGRVGACCARGGARSIITPHQHKFTH